MYNQRQPINQRVVFIGAPQTPQTEMKPKIKAVKCPNCGANNYVTTGESTECEYCSTPL